MKFFIMDINGHSEECYGQAEREKAEARFAELLARGFTAAERAEGATDYQLARKLPADATNEVLFVPRLKGG